MSKLAAYVASWQRGELELAPITALLGIRPLALGDGEARIELDASKRLYNAMGTVHGGIFCDLADVAMGVALATAVADGETFSTLQLQMSYFRPIKEGRLVATARVLRRGRTTAHLECDITDGSEGEDGGDGNLVAKATSVCQVRQARGR